MSIKNDNRIIDLQKSIELKEKSLQKPNFQPKTNCNLILNDKRYNLHVLEENDLILLMVQLNSLILSAKDLKINVDNVKISGFNLSDWMTDIQSRIEVFSYQKNVKDLESMKKQLSKLLSEDKRTELELDSIESTLKNM